MPEIECAPLEIHVQPGESHLVRQPAILRTILGSCVGVTFRSERLGIAALCHPMLPRHPGGASPGMDLEASRRYVDFAIRDLSRQFEALGAAHSEIQVKIFGGADVLAVSESGRSRPTVGMLNCEMAFNVLRDEGLIPIASRIRGVSGLNLQFHTRTGEVLIRPLT
jgi:chemotaxis protein CheD